MTAMVETEAGRRRRARWLRIALAISLALTAVAWAKLAPAAEASAPVTQFEAYPTTTQAAGHPDLVVQFKVAFGGETPVPCDCNYLKDAIVNTPPGVLGIPRNIPRCTSVEFSLHECPVESQVGIANVECLCIGRHHQQILAIFNMEPRPEQTALVAIEMPVISLGPIYTSFTVRTESDYGLEAKTFGLPAVNPVLEGSSYIFWGVPGDPIHDELRAPLPPNQWLQEGGAFTEKFRQTYCAIDVTEALVQHTFPAGICGGAPFLTPYNGPPEPFLTNPTRCSGASIAAIETLAYDQETDHATASYPQATGCDLLRFDPTLSGKPTTTEADSPSGLDLELTVPQSVGANSPAPSQIRATTIRLPRGFTVNSNAVDGKVACTDTEARLGTRLEAECPEHSKIGSLAIHSSALPGVLRGAVYLAEPIPGNRYRTFLVADGFSLHVKIPGVIELDPATGQVVITTRDLPQAPFEKFTVHIFGAERGVLSTPEQCGTYPVETSFTPWAEGLPDQTSTQFFTIDSGPGGGPCPNGTRPFSPSFAAGSADNAAGRHAPFAVRITRGDGEQQLSGVTIKTPPGFSGSLRGIPYCPEAAIARLGDSLYSGLAELAAPACPPASEVGIAAASAGSGSRPLHVYGKTYLAGPYRGAPLSLVVVIPAVSGPYDLGNIAVRTAIDVNPVNAQVTATSDPLPLIVEGVPLRTRSILVNLDRPGFALNPTNCDRASVGGAVFGDQGGVAKLSSPFQVANCAVLDYAPKLSLRLTGGVRRRGHPAIHAVFRGKAGEANTRRVSVTLPQGELLDNAHIGAVCTRVAFAQDRCPASARIGRAQVTTPLLDAPLEGTVYLRSSSNQLPDMALDLEGQIDIELSARVDSVKGALRTTFEAVPDAPVTKVKLDLVGGKRGLLQNTESLCGAGKRATVKLVGQNGKRFTQKVPLNPRCGKSSRKRRGSRHAGATGGGR